MPPPTTVDQSLLSLIQAQFGSTNFGQFQAIRYTWWSKLTYAQAGANEFAFFSDVVGQNSVTLAQTNMTRSNSFSQRAFLVRSLRTQFYMAASTMAGATVAATYLGVTHDVVNSNSSLEWKIADKVYLQLGQPLVYAPFGSGVTHNAISAMQPSTSALNIIAYGQAAAGGPDIYVCEPPQLIEAETVFTIKINYPTAVALNSSTTGVIGCYLDGVVFRPQQ